MVPPDSRQVSRVWRYLGYPREARFFRLKGFHLLRLAFPCHSSRTELGNSRMWVPRPRRGRSLRRFRLIPVRSPLLGESRFLSSPAGTEMFQFPAFPPLARYQNMTSGRFPDLGDLRIKAYLRLPGAYRSYATSFLGSGRQGIHHTLFLA